MLRIDGRQPSPGVDDANKCRYPNRTADACPKGKHNGSVIPVTNGSMN